MSDRKNSIARDLGTLFRLGAIGGLPDRELLGRFVERQEADAFEAIVQRHGPMVWGVCRRVLRDRHDAEDAFQATFLVLARRSASVMPREKLGNWLYGVAYQTARKARATRDKRRIREGRVPAQPEPMAASDSPDAAIEALERELSRLPEKYRIPIILCELEGNTHLETARQLGWPVGTVSSRLVRGKTLLAKRLSRPGTILTVSSLASLLAQDAASATMPTHLVGSTAQAASLVAAGGALSAGMVSADVAALTGEVLKIMLLGKLKLAMTAVLGCLVLAAGATRFAYLAVAADPVKNAKPEIKADEPAAPPRAENNKASTLPRSLNRRDPAMERQTEKIFDTLDRTVEVRFPNETPLEEFLKFVQVQSQSPELPTGIPIYVDPVGLQEAEKTLQSPIILDVGSIPLRTSVKLALRQLGLVYRVKDGFMKIDYEDSEGGGESLILELQNKAEQGELTPEEENELTRMLETRIKIKKMLVEIEKLEAKSRKLKPVRPPNTNAGGGGGGLQ